MPLRCPNFFPNGAFEDDGKMKEMPRFMSKKIFAILLCSSSLNCLLASQLRPASIKRYSKMVEIDARTGKIKGSLTYSQCATVTLAIKNKQPFLYTYSINSKVATIPEPGLQVLASLFGPTLKLLEAGAGEPGPGGDISIASTEPLASCPGAKELATELASSISKFLSQSSKAVVEFSIFKAEYNKSWSILQDAEATEAELESAAEQLLNLEDRLSVHKENFEKLSKRLTQMSGWANALLALTETEPCKKAFEAERAKATLFIDAADGYKSNVDAGINETKVMTSGISHTKKVLQDPDRYESPADESFGPYANPTKVEVTLTANEIGAKATKKFSVELQFGSSRFAAAAGLAFSPLNTIEYGRVLSPTSDTETIVKVGRTSSSNFRLWPMAMVHARMNSCSASFMPVYFSLGATAKADNKGTTPEFLIGISIPILAEKVFLTGGAYIGQVQSLQGGFVEGSVVPEKVSQLPVTKGYTTRIGFGISYSF